MKPRLHIAIDGPVAAGKGSVASNVAQRLNILYFDTGAMYRAVALIGLKNGINLENPEQLLLILKSYEISEKPYADHGGTQVFINNEDVTKQIREEEISHGSSVVAKHPAIRKYLVNIQQKIARDNSVVMEGRDITSVVIPDADVKIYLTASVEERARRRYEELVSRGEDVTYTQILAETKTRDYRDSHRAASPLTKVTDAIEIDTTNLTIDEVVDTIVAIAKKQPSHDTP